MYLLQLIDKILGLRNQRTLRLTLKVFGKLCMKTLQRLYLVSHCRLELKQREQLGLELLIKFVLCALNEQFELLALLLLGLGHFFDRRLCVAHVLTQLLEAFEQASRLLLDLLHVTLVDHLQTLERVGLVLLSKHRTVRANGRATGVAKVVQGRPVVLRTHFLFRLQCLGLKGIYGGCDFLDKAAVYQLIDS